MSFIAGKPLFCPPRYPVDGFKTEYISSPYLRGLSYLLPRGGGRLENLDRFKRDECIDNISEKWIVFTQEGDYEFY